LRQELADIGSTEASEAVAALLTEATRFHVIADVPVGSFLSGGIDSAVVTGLMGEATGQAVKSFSIGFAAQSEVSDERSLARGTSSLLGTIHHEHEVSPTDIAQLFDSFLNDIDQPSVDGFNTWLVSRYARQHVPVALSGLGGDEFFAGYPHFNGLAQPGLPLPPALKNGLRWLAGEAHAWIPRGPLFRTMFRTSDIVGRFALLRRLLQDGNLHRALRRRELLSDSANIEGTMTDWVFWDGDHIQRVSYWEVCGYLLSTLLRDADAMSMAHGLELRPVLLDHKLVEFVFSLPERVKVSGPGPKPLLVNASRRFVPEPSINSPKKGFNLPVRTWMVGAMQDRIEEALRNTCIRELFKDSYLGGLSGQIRTGKGSPELWAWTVLAAWLTKNRVTL
jgi:asparagine synthase (glutamine-hydrolysing)